MRIGIICAIKIRGSEEVKSMHAYGKVEMCKIHDWLNYF